MRYVVFFLFWLIPFLSKAQALQDINYNYLYNPSEKFSFSLKPVRLEEGWHVLYKMEVQGQEVNLHKYSIQWERRERLNESEGVFFHRDSTSNISLVRNNNIISGRVVVQASSASMMIVARVIDNESMRAWIFYEILRPNYPVTGYLVSAQGVEEIRSFINAGSGYSIQGAQLNSQPFVVSYYTHEFPAAAPAFSEALARVTPAIKVDSTFKVFDREPIVFNDNGMYLVQKDTGAADGFSFRVYDDYPKYTRIENLVDPLVYITTRQEFDRLKQGRGDKKTFDRVILNMTGSSERARDFMRSYFRRVELANQFFSSYKEGWKTDRGMVYIICGIPDEVYRFVDREVWTYKNVASFDFVLSGTLFDPDNYVLIRNKKFQDTWYEAVDLWRNARF